ncbi:hypothetical protein GGR50DRAFT_687482 [Xylaria sp. CBS 124048]|nr:hypothetical protein GGR50DRAFT_687482 [Xylaria sp. CBS 124048]
MSIPYHSPQSESSPDSAGGAGKLSTTSSPKGVKEFEQPNTHKRKFDENDDDYDEDDDDDSRPPAKKTTHNMIEKRYRTNINNKIAALQDAVPSLRIMAKSSRGEDTTKDRKELQGLTPAHKLNKATILSKATEYIKHLESLNSQLMTKNAALQQEITAFMAGARPTTYPQGSPIYTPSTMSASSRAEPQGMIQVPADMKLIINAQAAAGQAYPVPQQTFRPNPTIVRQQEIRQRTQAQTGGLSRARPYQGQLLVGALAGLILLEAAVENEKSNETPGGRGLFALPIQMLEFLTSNLNIRFMGYSMPATQSLYLVKMVLLLCSLWWAFMMPSLTDSQSPSKKESKQVVSAPKAAPSLASPIHVRRQAWLTAIQTIWVPRRHILLEVSALGLKTLKLSLRNLVGIRGYQMLTGLTLDDEIARVKAWGIALDAQLAGGDIEISRRRLLLTLIASSTLPTTPLRLMLKALHIRILLWDCGATGMQTVLQVVAAKCARSYWNEAKQLYRLTIQLRRSGHEFPDEDLPDHLSALLEQDCDEVLNPSIIQRAHNLTWNRPTEHNEISSTDGMAYVVDDVAVRSPMDAVAAWWSTMILQGVLNASLLDSEDEPNEAPIRIDHDVCLAVRTAPIGSVAQQRALVAKALLLDEKRNIHIVSALHAVGPVTHILMTDEECSRAAKYTTTVDTSIKDMTSSQIITTELCTSLLSAMVIAHLHKYSPPEEPDDIYWTVQHLKPACEMGLLGYTAAYKLMDKLARHELAAEQCSSTLECLSASLRLSTGKDGVLESEIKQRIVKRCLVVTRSIMGMNFETDTGYGSMSDDETDDETMPARDSNPQLEETEAHISCGCDL